MNTITRTPLRVRHETRLRLVQVRRVEALSLRMRRVVLGGEAMDGFVTAAADDHVKLFFPAPGQDRPNLPTLDAADAGGPAGGDAARAAVREYTPRRFDAAARELTIDFVLHGHGPASEWAATRAAPGAWLGVGGPRSSVLMPDDYDAYLLVGDETALPCIARRLEELPPGARAIALIEVADADEERFLPSAGNVSLVWLHRNGAPPGATGLLYDALASLTLPAGDVQAWVACEIETARSLRTLLLERHRMPRERISAAGYWRLGEPGASGRVDG